MTTTHDLWADPMPATRTNGRSSGLEVAAPAPAPAPAPAHAPLLSAAAIARAVAANRVHARTFGWGCVRAGRVQAIPEVLTRLVPNMVVRLLRFAGPNAGENLAESIADWQRSAHLPVTGQLDRATWQRMLPHLGLPAAHFPQTRWPVRIGGRVVGVLENTAPYRACYFDPVPHAPCRPARSGIPGEFGGAQLQLGFRVTDIDAVRRAGFVDTHDDVTFRWIQVLEFNMVPIVPMPAPSGHMRRDTRAVDPTVWGPAPDPHPYYFQEPPLPPADPWAPPPGAADWINVDNHRLQQGPNGLCYDLLFEDQPKSPLSWADPGRRTYWNLEVALVGVRGGIGGPVTRNVVLNTVRWGYDIVVSAGVPPAVKLNPLQAGPFGGSAMFRGILNRDQARTPPLYPGHCFVGAGYSGAARCH